MYNNYFIKIFCNVIKLQNIELQNVKYRISYFLLLYFYNIFISTLSQIFTYFIAIDIF